MRGILNNRLVLKLASAFYRPSDMNKRKEASFPNKEKDRFSEMEAELDKLLKNKRG